MRRSVLTPIAAAASVICLGACAGPSQPAEKTVPATPKKAAQAKVSQKSGKNYKKPVRMNGRGKVESISLEDFFVLHQSGDALVFDARPTFFYRLGHIPGAKSLPVHGNDSDAAIHAQEASIKAGLASGKTIVVYCSGITCPDARSLAIHFSGFGYPVKIFSGGWNAWKNAGMPTE